jgi:hypothetical protein
MTLMRHAHTCVWSVLNFRHSRRALRRGRTGVASPDARQLRVNYQAGGQNSIFEA